MFRLSKRLLLPTLAGVAGVLVAQGSHTEVAAQVIPPAQVIATGLDNPRGLAFGPGGLLYVVEAGRGGDSQLCLPSATGPGDVCYGPSGAVTQISGILVQQRVLTGLPSLAGASGDEATGPHDIQFAFNSAWITVGVGADPNLRQPFEDAGVSLGSLIQVLSTGQWSPIVDISAFEAASNPDGGAFDSNPYGLAMLSNRALVTDAGANALLQIDAAGTVSSLAVFPERMVPGPGGVDVPMQSVPTSVVEGPDGSLFVGQLTGFPFPVGWARVYRVPAEGGDPEVVAEDFTNIIDLAIGPDGAAYVLEHDVDGILGPGTTGRLTKIGLFGSRTELAAGELDTPGGIVIGPDNAVYVTTHSTSAGGGEVVRIPQEATISS